MCMKKIIKVLTLGLTFMAVLVFCACSTNKKDDNNNNDSKWTNDNAVYAYVKAGFENEILKDVEVAFESFHFQTVYITEKNTNEWTPLKLLFILDKDDTENKQDFFRLLEEDERIDGASLCRDIEFKTVDTRRIEKEKDTIAIGEEMRLTLSGSRDYYVQPFDFGKIHAKPSSNKSYSVEDFVGIDLKSITMENDGWLCFELVEENYFNVIIAADILSRLPEMEKVEPDWNRISIIPPIWEISDESVLSLDMDTNGDAIIRGLKSGEVIVKFAEVSCKIKVN